jgi:hypothetical protein
MLCKIQGTKPPRILQFLSRSGNENARTLAASHFGIRKFGGSLFISIFTSVADPEPTDPYVFEPPGSGSRSF